MVARSLGELAAERADYEAQMIFTALLNPPIEGVEERPGSGSDVTYSDDPGDWSTVPVNYYQRRVAGAAVDPGETIGRAVVYQDYLWIPWGVPVDVGYRVESVSLDDGTEMLRGDYARVVELRVLETHIEAALETIRGGH